MGVKAYSTDAFVLPLPAGHRFPMEKYRLLREAVSDWPELEVVEPPAATDEALGLVHTQAYLKAMVEGSLPTAMVAEIGFPWSPAMVERSRRSTGATMAAAVAALSGEGLAFNLAGGTHHAFADRGEGFCCFNDAAVAARWVQAQGLAHRVLILDLDVHQAMAQPASLKATSRSSQSPSMESRTTHFTRNPPIWTSHFRAVLMTRPMLPPLARPWPWRIGRVPLTSWSTLQERILWPLTALVNSPQP